MIGPEPAPVPARRVAEDRDAEERARARSAALSAQLDLAASRTRTGVRAHRVRAFARWVTPYVIVIVSFIALGLLSAAVEPLNR